MASGAIDVHHHILPPPYQKAIGGRIGAQGLLGKVPDWSPEISLDAMDRNNIRAAITSVSAPGIYFGDKAEAAQLARACNEYAAQMKRDHRGRFGFFAVLPMPGVDESLKEIEYAFDTLGADGVGLMTNVGGRYPGEADFLPVFAELNRRKAVAFFHPVAGAYDNPMPHVPQPTLEFVFDTTRAITSMLFGGTLAKSHDMRFLFSHGGGAVPFLIHRIARLTVRPEFKAEVPDGVMAELSRLLLDTALTSSITAFEPIRRMVPMSNVLFGSDFPHAGEPTLVATLKGVEDVSPNADEREAITFGNAMRLFPNLGL